MNTTKQAHEGEAGTRVIAVDLAKNVFQVCVMGAQGTVESNVAVKRARLLSYVKGLGRGVVALEACGSAHYWGREFQALGYEVRMIPAQHVKAFTRRHKSDAHDALAIAEASVRPKVHFVPVKSVLQQDAALLSHRRSRLVRARTALCNEMRGHLAEYGVVLPVKRQSLLEAIPELLKDTRLSQTLRSVVGDLHAEIETMSVRIAQIERDLVTTMEAFPAYTQLLEVPGIGPVVAACLLSAVGGCEQFRNGRQLAAWAGLVPRQRGSGGKTQLLGITKHGDREVRTVLIHGARAVYRWLERRSDPLAQWMSGVDERRGHKRAVVALANKIARIAFPIIRHKVRFDMRKAFSRNHAAPSAA